MKKILFKPTFLFLLVLLLWALTGYAFQPEQPTDTLGFTPSPIVSTLCKDINDFISVHPQHGIIGVSIKDLTSDQFLSINGNIQFNPASVIKVAVMAEVFHQIEQKKMSLQDTITLEQSNHMPGSGRLYFQRTGSKFSVAYLIDKMITESDNTATNMLMHDVGIENINNFMTSLGLFATVIKDDTLLCKIPDQHNWSTTDDMLKLLDMMYHGELVSPQASKAMIDVMLTQKLKWGIPHSLPADLPIANKTGSLDGVRNDIAIIYAKDHPYIVAIFTGEVPSNIEATNLVRHLSKLIYDRMTATAPQVSRHPSAEHLIS